MPQYLLTGRSADGRQATEVVEADSADQAVELFSKRGFTDIVLHTDDVMAAGTDASEWDDEVSAEDFVKFASMGTVGYWWYLVRRVFRGTWLIWGGASLWLAQRRYVGDVWGVLDFVLTGILILTILWAVFAAWMGRTRQQYDRLIHLINWGEWEEALEMCDQLQGSTVPASELILRRAEAIAGMGRLDEALKIAAEAANEDDMPNWLYAGRLEEVYSNAGDLDGALRQAETALQLVPNNPTVLLDAARARLLYQRDAESTPGLLARAREHQMAEVLQPFRGFLEGLILLEHGRTEQARETIETAISDQVQFRPASPAAIDALLDVMRFHLAIAYGRLGNLEQSHRLYQRVEPRFVALNADYLMHRYIDEFGEPPRLHAAVDSPYRPPSSL